MIDSTPDISHTDQLAYVIRYVRDDGFPVKRFMCCLPNVGHKSEILEMAVMSFLTKHDIDINNCRGASRTTTPPICLEFSRVYRQG